MSQYSEDYNTIQEEVERKAQKPYRCDACREIIPRKIKYWAISWLFDGPLPKGYAAKGKLRADLECLNLRLARS